MFHSSTLYPRLISTNPITEVEEEFQEITISRGLEMTFDLDVNNKAAVEIVVDQVSGSTLTGKRFWEFIDGNQYRWKI